MNPLRDVLTILAGLLIVVLAALLAVPPFIDWPAHRALVEKAMARAAGTEIRIEGPFDIRLLPTPQLRARRLIVGSTAPDAVSVDAAYLKAEIALTPLLSGEVRLRDARTGRVEIKVPVAAGPDWRVRAGLLSGRETSRSYVVESLAVRHFLVTGVDPSTGRTRQLDAQDVRIQAASLAGPWRVEGRAGPVPFELSLGEVGPDRAATLKLGGGGGSVPRFDVDGRFELVGSGDTLQPRFAGSGRMTASPFVGVPDVPAWPIQAQAAVTASGLAVELDNLIVEAGSGVPLRLAGEARYRTDESRLAVSLAGRRFDLAAFRSTYGTAALSRLAGLRLPAGLPVDLSVKLDSLAAGGDEELSNVRLEASVNGPRLQVSAGEASGPGGSGLKIAGEIVLADPGAGTPATASGHVALTARESDRFGRYLASVGLGYGTEILDGAPLSASADVTVAVPVLSLRNLRLGLGPARVTGALRRTEAEAGARARIDAQLALEGIDIAALPDGGPLFAVAREADLGLTIDARGVAYGSAGGGRITGRISTDGPAILVERLEVRDLANADANLSGRILPDGSGRIDGRLRAPQAAPLVDLFGRTWLGGLVRLVPDIAREGSVDVGVEAERVAGKGGPRSDLRTRVQGRLGGGGFKATTLSSAGRLIDLEATVSVEDGTAWTGGQVSAGSRRPARFELSGRRDGSGRLALDLNGEVAGVALVTTQPIELGPGEDAVEAGTVRLTSPDASGLLSALGLPASGPAPLQLAAAVKRHDGLRVSVNGRAGGEAVSAELTATDEGGITGSASLGRLSLPWLASALALRVPDAARTAGASWSTTRFGAYEAPLATGSVRIDAALLDFGAGLVGRDAALTVSTRPDGFRLDDLQVALAGGRLRGTVTVGRQGGLASLIGEGSAEGLRLGDFLKAPFGAGQVSGSLRFGASGESVAGLVANFGGAGEIALDGVSVAGADPGAVTRVASRVLRSDDPLSSARWQPLLAEELNRGPLAAGKSLTPASVVGGTLRLTPLRAEADAGWWQGSASLDWKSMTLDVRGILQSAASPPRWTGAAPSIALGWSGPLARPTRIVDPGPLVNGLAAVVLARELDRIENFELDAAEQGRRNSRTEMDRQRRLAAEEAVRQARLKAEAEERARQEAERQRREAEEQARLEAERRREAERQRREAERQRDAERRADPGFPPAPPMDIRPPAQTGGR